MRQFLVVAHDAPASADFPLDALASEAGRMDLLARALNAALLESHGIREDTRVHLVIDGVTVSVDGATVRNLHPDERSIAALLRSALKAREDAIGHQPAEPSPGVAVYRMGLEATLDRLAREGPIVQLHEGGDPAVEVSVPEDPVFVLSDHRDFTDEEADLIAERADARVRLGPRPLHADHAISVAHNWLDTDGYTEY
ncbi:tRNA (pseudouridine(54)-N(1))-methyltransferase TrmY [Halapricum desulfuricans]|uniref:tRNA (pseudouridine(54)-N(1))-methyltransferase n=1 Tax=Halapricum desulfuricans TaxID=2841257 RepID=A0A897N5Y7_9EURY|nr:tRNA (pseudouridine(54)-N(1))-methyltransferase TrmY [Halapricum desulfuricans]QSG06479.1 RNA base methyltransferase family enzyme [Halapricum desulfuricans]